MKRDLLQLAHVYNPAKHKIGGFYMSSKLDGTRCFWDGGITRGLPTEEVPWASVLDPKTKQRKAKIKPVSTGLWSRYGNPIIAPDRFLNQLPCCFLDGELWSGPGSFQLCRSICAGDKPDPRFNQIQYAIYSAPSFGSLFQSGTIGDKNIVCEIDYDRIRDFVTDCLKDFEGDFLFSKAGCFEDEVEFMSRNLETQADHCFMLKQEKLSADEAVAKARVEEYLNDVLAEGGEGVVLRNPAAVWTPKRHKGILKHKPFNDDEGEVVGFTSGRETDKGSRLLGRIGALVLKYNNMRLELSGLTDEERLFKTTNMVAYATGHPGEDMPAHFQGVHFRVGQTVSFKYRELSDDGVPKEARYYRKRDVE